jgi:alkyl hydroperoxide reductase subunit D
MNVLANPGVEKVDFELWSSAVSAINGCGMCLDSHKVELKQLAVPATNIQGVLRIASVFVAASAVLRPIQYTNH